MNHGTTQHPDCARAELLSRNGSQEKPMKKYTFEDHTGEIVTVYVDASDDYLKKLIHFEAGGAEFGNIFCFWEMDTFVQAAQASFLPVIRHWVKKRHDEGEGVSVSAEELIPHLQDYCFQILREQYQVVVYSLTEMQFKLLCDVNELVLSKAQIEVTINGIQQNIPLVPQEKIKKLRDLLERMHKKAHHQRLGIIPGGNRRQPTDLSELRTSYDEVIEDWREAAEMYERMQRERKTQRQRDWRSAISLAYPALPPDLIELLQAPADWPGEMADFHEKKGWTNKPEDLAIVHAARLCNAPDGKYKLSYLKKKLSELSN
jgi:hypothetical protein